MGRLCTAWQHPQRDAINAALLEHTTGYRHIAARFGLAWSSLRRHEQTHLRATLQHSKELAMSLSADNLLAEVGKWHERMEAQYAKADAANEIATTATVARVGLAAIDLFAKLGPLAELEERLQRLEERSDAHDTAR
jgi:hypothetical protein